MLAVLSRINKRMSKTQVSVPDPSTAREGDYREAASPLQEQQWEKYVWHTTQP